MAGSNGKVVSAVHEAQSGKKKKTTRKRVEEEEEEAQLEQRISVKGKRKMDVLGLFFLLVLVLVSIFAYPCPGFSTECFKVDATPTLHQVFYFGWITAISTGLGVVPFFFVSEPNKFWMGVSNALAGGMMLAASYSLAFEGANFAEAQEIDPFYRTGLGVLLGILFIVVTKNVLAGHEDVKLGEIQGASAQKMILIVFVMFLHSLTEGISIGVSFGGKNGNSLGKFISLSLAVHNVPEGLAVALVLTSRKVSILRTGLWAIFTSLPQPFMAIPAFIFVGEFVPLKPVGLGFASGAMAYVAVFELLVEAVEDSSIPVTAVVGACACAVMTYLQEAVKSL